MQSNGVWTENVLHDNTYADGIFPEDGVIVDANGNIYAAYNIGGQYPCMYFDGAVSQYSPSGSGWAFNLLHCFEGADNDGEFPSGGLLMDSSGNLYGTTNAGGVANAGVVFLLTPGSGGWSESIIHQFSGQVGGGPAASLTMDATGNLYGTATEDGPTQFGSAFKLTPSNGGWNYSTLHTFTYYFDGAYPQSNVVFDSNGNLFGTTGFAGPGGYGTVWEITP